MKAAIERCMHKWEIESYWDFFIINIVFSLAGMSVVWIRKPLYELIGINETTPLWIKILVYIPLVIPIYQFNLICYGTLLGKFQFFWKKEKQLARFLLKPFRQNT